MTPCLHHVFEAHVQQRPEAIAISFGEAALTYGELNVRANRLAHYLRTVGVGPDVLVGLSVDRSPDVIVSMLAILKAGGAYVPLDPTYPSDRLAYMVRDAQVPVLLVGGPSRPELATPHVKVVSLDADREAIDRQPADNPDSHVSHESLMYVMYTSGSTGRPKGIMVTHGNVARLFPATSAYLQFDAHDTWTLFHSYSFGFSVWEIWGALAHGGRLVIVPHGIGQSPAEFYELVCRERVTVLSQTPSAFSLFLLADRGSKSPQALNLRFIVFSGEPLESALVESWIARHGDERPQLVNMYAITETSGEITYRRLTSRDVTQAARSVIGVPLPDVQIFLLDEERQPVPDGSPGEMYVSSAAVARGYLNLPEMTAQKFVQGRVGDRQDVRLYRTGDRARYLPNGEIEFLGRVDDQVKIRGHRVELAEVQAVLGAHPAVSEAVVVAQSDLSTDTRLVAYVVPRTPQNDEAGNGNGATPTTAILQGYLKTKLPEYMVPTTFMQLDKVPRLPNGKIDRQGLPSARDVQRPSHERSTEEQALADIWGLDTRPTTPGAGVLDARAAVNASYEEPRTFVERTVAQIWKEVLGVGRVGLHDDFFQLGGNSLLVAQSLYRINDALRVNVTMRQLFDAGSVSGLALLITDSQAEQIESEELARILADVAEYSDEDVRRLLGDRADRQPDADASSPAVSRASADDETGYDAYMRMIVAKAKDAIRDNQVPVAACLVKDGRVVACAYNSVRHDVDVTAHAEMQVLRESCRALNSVDLSGCVLYSTLEPCPMCFSACDWANVSKVIYGARRDDAKKVGLGGPGLPVHRCKEMLHSPIEVVDDVLRQENVEVLELWLKGRSASSSQHASSQYDGIAEGFRQTKRSPVNRHVLDHTLFDMVGELVHDKSILDLACGEGHYCRELKRRGAARVVGVDISSRMIALAREQEARERAGIEYLRGDALELEKIDDFDLVLGCFLLNYARTREQLAAMCRAIFENLKPGGHFIALNENFTQSPGAFHGYERYGYAKAMTEPYREGAAITYTMWTGTDELQFVGHYWSRETYQSAFEAAGFTHIQLRNPSCSPEGIEQYGQRFWQNVVDNPPFIGLVGLK